VKKVPLHRRDAENAEFFCVFLCALCVSAVKKVLRVKSAKY